MTASKEYLRLMFVSWVHNFVCVFTEKVKRVMERGIAPICNPSTINRQCVTLSKHIAVSQHCPKMNLTSTQIWGPVDYLSASLAQIYSHHIKRVSKSHALLKRAPRVHMHHIPLSEGGESTRGERISMDDQQACQLRKISRSWTFHGLQLPDTFQFVAVCWKAFVKSFWQVKNGSKHRLQLKVCAGRSFHILQHICNKSNATNLKIPLLHLEGSALILLFQWK